MTIDINSIQSTYATQDIAALTSASTQQGVTGTGSASSAVSVDLSQPGQLWSQLQSLAQNNPTEFKQVTADIASQLKDAASSATGGQAQFLTNLSNRFQAASQSGSMSDLAPPASQGQGVHHGHHHHHAQAAQSTTDSSQSSSTGQSSTDSLMQQIQSIIANALQAASSSAASSG